MEKNELESEEPAEDINQPDVNEINGSKHDKSKQQQKNMNQDNINESESETQNQTSTSHKQLSQSKIVGALDKIYVQSPIKKSTPKNQSKSFEKPTFSINKIIEKKDINSSKQKKKSNTGSISKNMNESSMKSTIKSNQNIKKVNKPFYEETFYITGMKQNYLLLLSDNNQVLEFPIGMFTKQGGVNLEENQIQREQNQNTDQFHLIKDIKIGQAIKIKLQFDFFRQEKDEKLFNSLQRKIHQEYCEQQDEFIEIRSKEKSPKRRIN